MPIWFPAPVYPPYPPFTWIQLRYWLQFRLPRYLVTLVIVDTLVEHTFYIAVPAYGCLQLPYHTPCCAFVCLFCAFIDCIWLVPLQHTHGLRWLQLITDLHTLVCSHVAFVWCRFVFFLHLRDAFAFGCRFGCTRRVAVTTALLHPRLLRLLPVGLFAHTARMPHCCFAFTLPLRTRFWFCTLLRYLLCPVGFVAPFIDLTVFYVYGCYPLVCSLPLTRCRLRVYGVTVTHALFDYVYAYGCGLPRAPFTGWFGVTRSILHTLDRYAHAFVTVATLRFTRTFWLCVTFLPALLPLYRCYTRCVVYGLLWFVPITFTPGCWVMRTRAFPCGLSSPFTPLRLVTSQDYYGLAFVVDTHCPRCHVRISRFVFTFDVTRLTFTPLWFLTPPGSPPPHPALYRFAWHHTYAFWLRFARHAFG